MQRDRQGLTAGRILNTAAVFQESAMIIFLKRG